jgi:hypothetical protein
MRRELINRLDRAVTGDNIALLASVQACIEACTAAVVDDPHGRTLMRVSEQTYAEIFGYLSQPGYEHALVGENGEIDLKGIRLISVGTVDFAK